MKKFTKEKILKEIKSITIIVVVVFAFRSTFFEPFRIPSGSMIPTLMIGDFILVNKLSYGIKIPFTDMYWDPIYITKFSPPKRGDIIVFKYPKDENINYIKRVVAEPGDELELIDKRLYVNGKPSEIKEIDGKKIMEDMDEKFKYFNFLFYESKVGKKTHILQKLDGRGPRDYYPKTIVPKGKYFVMGDNRDFSADSRFWGFVDERLIKGKALFVWFSFILPFTEHPTKLRLHRIGTVLK